MLFHQVLVGAAPHDAITNMARELRAVLAQCGESEIFAENRAPGVPDVLPLHRFPRSVGDDGIIVFHVSHGDPAVFQFLLSRPERLLVVFHNFSPAEHFEMVDPERAAMLRWGWRELELLRPRVAAVVADSRTNAEAMVAWGWDDADIHVIAAGVRPDRLLRTAPDPSAMETLGAFAGAPLLVYTGQCLPHKRVDVLLHMQLVLDRVGVRSVLAIAGPATNQILQRAVAEEARDLRIPRVAMLGPLGDDALSALFRNADLLVTASEHEGLCLPALEAMSMGVPVVARAAGALPETLGPGGLALPSDAGPLEFAEAVRELHCDPSLAATVGLAGRRRAADFDFETGLARFLGVIEELV